MVALRLSTNLVQLKCLIPKCSTSREAFFVHERFEKSVPVVDTSLAEDKTRALCTALNEHCKKYDEDISDARHKKSRFGVSVCF